VEVLGQLVEGHGELGLASGLLEAFAHLVDFEGVLAVFGQNLVPHLRALVREERELLFFHLQPRVR